MYAVGLTGGIASGKSVVADQFALLGVPVIDADCIARELVAPGQPALATVIAHFGAALLNPDGSLNRARLRQQVFADAKARAWLDALLHPLIYTQMQALRAANPAPYGLLVVPLLFETGRQTWVDRVLVVTATPQQQRQRLVLRDSISELQISQMLAAQCSSEARLKHADDIIDNTSDISELAAQVYRLHQKYQQLATYSAAN